MVNIFKKNTWYRNVLVFTSTLVVGMVVMIAGASAKPKNEMMSNSSSSMELVSGSNSNTAKILETYNPLAQVKTTAYGNAGVSKVWISGGAIWFSVKLYDYPVYNWTGSLHVSFTNGKVRNFPVGGMGVAGKTWTGHRSYKAYGKHGKATLSGYAVSVTGKKATVLHPYSSF